MPRTAAGQPDLQGVWASDSATPLERPEQLADKAFLTDEEVATLQARAAELFNGETDAAFGESVFRAVLEDAKDFSSRDRQTGNYNQFWLIDRWFDDRTSLIVDPADGRIPPLTPEAQARREAQAEARRARSGPPRGHEDLGGMRCLGGGVPMTGRRYNSNYQIVQSAGQEVILMEMMHDTRIIPLDGRPHLPTTVRSRPLRDVGLRSSEHDSPPLPGVFCWTAVEGRLDVRLPARAAPWCRPRGVQKLISWCAQARVGHRRPAEVRYAAVPALLMPPGTIFGGCEAYAQRATLRSRSEVARDSSRSRCLTPDRSTRQTIVRWRYSGRGGISSQ